MSQAVERRRDIGGCGGDVLSPFYDPPHKTSAQIIREARQSLSVGMGVNVGNVNVGVQRVGVKTVHTKRPFTPRERERTLFGTSISTSKGDRPPSSFT